MADIYINGISVVSKHGTELDMYWRNLNTDGSVCSALPYEKKNHNNPEAYFIAICKEGIEASARDAAVTLNMADGCIVVGTGMGLSDLFLYRDNLPYHYLSQLKDKIASALGSDIPVILIANACCAGAQAIAYGFDLLRAGTYQYVIAGGAEVYSRITHDGFRRLYAVDETGCKPFDQNRKGIAMGEGAAFFVLQPSNASNPYCRLLGTSVTNDAYHIVAPAPEGLQIRRAVLQALEQAGLSKAEIDAVIAHGTGTPLNDRIEADVLYELFGEIDVTAPKGKIGHTGGAAGAFGLLTAVCCLKYQQLPYIVNLKVVDDLVKIRPVTYEPKNKKIEHILVNAFAFGGTNTALICGEA